MSGDLTSMIQLSLDNTPSTGETSQCAQFHQPLDFGGHGTYYQHTEVSAYDCLKFPGSQGKLFGAETLPQTLFSL